MSPTERFPFATLADALVPFLCPIESQYVIAALPPSTANVPAFMATVPWNVALPPVALTLPLPPLTATAPCTVPPSRAVSVE